MEKRFAFFLGCTIPASQFHVEAAARKSFEKLGVELVDMEGATCCSDPEISRQFDENLWIHIAARNISIAEKLNANIMTICNGCFDTLNKVNESLKNDKELKDKVNRDLQTIGREFKGTVEVLHAIEVLHDEIGLDTISKAAVKPLKNLRVALQPGCRLYHDEEKRLVEKFEALVKALGAQIIEYPLIRLCCGVPALYVDPEFSLMERTKRKLESIQSVNVDCIVTFCPACYDRLEKGQLDLRSRNINFNIPILNYFELLALALGIDPDDFGMYLHRIPADNVVEKIEEEA